MNQERLKLLRDVLIEVRDQKKPFDMNQWVDALHIEHVDCGTASCAYGWLARDPRAQAMGLSLRYNSANDALCVCLWGKPDSGTEFFDITPQQAYDLFMPASYRLSTIPIDAVIDRVDDLIG